MSGWAENMSLFLSGVATGALLLWFFFWPERVYDAQPYDREIEHMLWRSRMNIEKSKEIFNQ